MSATFAASLITSPALGTYLSRFYSENFVVALATAIAVFDLFFILVAVPESLPEKLRERSKTINWENIDPFKVCIAFLIQTIKKKRKSLKVYILVVKNNIRRSNYNSFVYYGVFIILTGSRSIFVFFRLSQTYRRICSTRCGLFYSLCWHPLLYCTGSKNK